MVEIAENAELGGLETGILLAALRAAGEPTRLRILALTARAELTVSELTQILGQSQPRVSRHLKLLCDAGLLDRFREGTWVFYRFSNGTSTVNLGRVITDLIPADDALIRADMLRLEAIKKGRAEAAADYFRANAGHWDEIRRLYVPESDVETVLSKHPSVAQCAVIGIPDDRWGEAVHAAVEPRDNAEIDAQALIAFVKQELGSVKAPKAIHVFASLPMSSVGKILKTEVREQILKR